MNNPTAAARFRIVKRAGMVAPIIAGISDMLVPLANYGTYISIGLAAILITIIAAERIQPLTAIASNIKWPSDVQALYTSYRGAPMIAATMVLIIVVGGFSYYSQLNRDNGGVIASNVSAVRDFQESAGIIEGIKQTNQSLAVIEKNTKDSLIEMRGLKKETSENPRKELANMGIGWYPYSFFESISSADLYVLNLFLKGGMSPIKYHEGPTPPANKYDTYGLKYYGDSIKVKKLIGLSDYKQSAGSHLMQISDSDEREKAANLLEEYSPNIFDDQQLAELAIIYLNADALKFYTSKSSSVKRHAIAKLDEVIDMLQANTPLWGAEFERACMNGERVLGEDVGPSGIGCQITLDIHFGTANIRTLLLKAVKDLRDNVT